MPAHPANALARESSPYLLQHAHNPVDWHAWNDAAFDLARRTQKPIFLSIGYSTCYWCHVMERQCFEDEGIAALMNEHFINIKVDREERPDVDDLYMTAVQLMTRRGGWPMSVFLTPPPPPAPPGGDATHADHAGYHLRPFWAGTYLPPQPMHGSPSFPQVLTAISEAWRDRRGDVLDSAAKIAAAVAQSLAGDGGDDHVTPDEKLVSAAANQLLRSYDDEHGGFGGAPKFPQPANLLLLLAVHRNSPDRQLAAALRHTLDRMARGGMFDQVGGGFHRYSTDERWRVPHFEKMLYDQGQLLEVYARAHADLPDADHPTAWADVCRATCDYALREMVGPNGAFSCAQDAEVDAREGGNYVWTADDVAAAIDDPTLRDLALDYYGLTLGPNFRDPHHEDAQPVNVLFVPTPTAAFAKKHGLSLGQLQQHVTAINTQLLAVRDRRKQPMTDDKVLVGWNGLMIGGMTVAGVALRETRYVDAAARAADAILAAMRTPDGGLFRTMRGGKAHTDAVLEDYALFARGLLAVHAATRDTRYLDTARDILDAAAQRFARPGGGYFDTLEGKSDLFVRARSLYDGAVPSGNSSMVHALLDLHQATGDRAPLEQAARDLQAAAGEMKRLGVGMVHMQHALLRALELGATFAAAEAHGVTPWASLDVVQLAVSPDRVTVTDAPQTITIAVTIADGYHLTAHDAAGEGATPTRLKLYEAPAVTCDVQYPPGQLREYAFAEGPLRVYEGTVTLRATLRKRGDGDTRGTLVLRYQPCTDSACLEVRELEVPVVIA